MKSIIRGISNWLLGCVPFYGIKVYTPSFPSGYWLMADKPKNDRAFLTIFQSVARARIAHPVYRDGGRATFRVEKFR